MIRQQTLQECLARTLDDILHLLEPAGATVIRVWHIGTGGLWIPLAEKVDPYVIAGPGQLLDVTEVLPIHCNYVVVVLQVSWRDLAAGAGDFDAPGTRGLDTPRVWWVTRVIPGRAGGVDDESVLDAALPNEVPEDGLGQRRATDVPKTHEKYRNPAVLHS